MGVVVFLVAFFLSYLGSGKNRGFSSSCFQITWLGSVVGAFPGVVGWIVGSCSLPTINLLTLASIFESFARFIYSPFLWLA